MKDSNSDLLMHFDTFWMYGNVWVCLLLKFLASWKLRIGLPGAPAVAVALGEADNESAVKFLCSVRQPRCSRLATWVWNREFGLKGTTDANIVGRTFPEYLTGLAPAATLGQFQLSSNLNLFRSYPVQGILYSWNFKYSEQRLLFAFALFHPFKDSSQRPWAMKRRWVSGVVR